MCRALGVSPAGYHARRERLPSARAEADAVLLRRIRTIHAASHGTYGAPRIHAELRAGGHRVGRKRVARLLRAAGLAGVSRRKGACARRGAGREEARPAPDLVERNFTAERPDRLRVAAITRLPAWAGFLYLAVVLDAFSRRVVGWSMADHLRTQLVLDALAMAVRRRRPHDVIHHPDRGSRYTSIALGLRCREAGGRPSMGSRSATPVTPRRARPSSPRASASCSTAGASARRPRRAGPCSPSSRAGTTRAGGTRRSALSLSPVEYVGSLSPVESERRTRADA
jgi:putative transposase